jgi:hypothetical protein
VSLSLAATGLNGYVTHIVIRWVMGGFKESFEDVLNACHLVYTALLQLLQSPRDAS